MDTLANYRLGRKCMIIFNEQGYITLFLNMSLSSAVQSNVMSKTLCKDPSS